MVGFQRAGEVDENATRRLEAKRKTRHIGNAARSVNFFYVKPTVPVPSRHPTVAAFWVWPLLSEC